jgi:tetratricopeptide (TPR) repeat protein
MWRPKHPWLAIVCLTVVAGGLGWCVWRWSDARRYRQAMAQVDEAMATGRNAVAARDLSAILAWRPNADRATYLLGVCEKARGRPKEADAAWAGIPPDSPLIGRAVLGRIDLLTDRGQLADAEQLVERVIAGRGEDGSAVAMLLIPTLVQEGRTEEAKQLIVSRWRSLNDKGEGATEQAINLARLHMELSWNPPPVDALRGYLEQAGRLAPDDDRIWLGRANLALRAGSNDEAARWIDACLKRRPEDPSVWRAWFEWAMRDNRFDDVRSALKRLPAQPPTAPERHRISAWLAAAQGDVTTERRELESLIDKAPEDFEALDRLEKLATTETTATITADLRQRRTDIERAQARYRELYARNQPSRDAPEVARLAERLGHRFEAIVFLTAAIADDPDDDALREALHRLEITTRTGNAASQTAFDTLERHRERHFAPSAPDRTPTRS